MSLTSFKTTTLSQLSFEQKCSVAVVLDPKEMEKDPKVICPSCKKEYCFNCRNDYHGFFFFFFFFYPTLLTIHLSSFPPLFP